MPPSRNVRDSGLIDALESAESTNYSGSVWRLVQEGRDPCLCSSAGGRWDDRTFDVLYTSLDRDGAISEIYFHLARGLPVIPSRVQYRLFELHINLQSVVNFPALEALSSIGLEIGSFGQLSYDERESEYPTTQDVAETAHFLEYSGMIVPSARWNCCNLVVFCDQAPPDSFEVKTDHGIINLSDWKSERSA